MQINLSLWRNLWMVRKNVLIYEVNLISHLQQQLLKYGKLAEVPLYIYYHYLWLQTPLR